jgi:hypothetical protein
MEVLKLSYLKQFRSIIGCLNRLPKNTPPLSYFILSLSFPVIIFTVTTIVCTNSSMAELKTSMVV